MRLASWGRGYVGGLGPLLGLMLAVLGRSWGLCGRPGAEKCEEHGYFEKFICAYFSSGSVICGLGGGLALLLDPLLAVLRRSWGLCWRSWAVLGPLFAVLRRSWAALGASVGGLGPHLGSLLAVLGRLGRKRSQTRAGKRSGKGTNPPGRARPPKAPTDFF